MCKHNYLLYVTVSVTTPLRDDRAGWVPGNDLLALYYPQTRLMVFILFANSRWYAVDHADGKSINVSQNSTYILLSTPFQGWILLDVRCHLRYISIYRAMYGLCNKSVHRFLSNARQSSPHQCKNVLCMVPIYIITPWSLPTLSSHGLTTVGDIHVTEDNSIASPTFSHFVLRSDTTACQCVDTTI